MKEKLPFHGEKQRHISGKEYLSTVRSNDIYISGKEIPFHSEGGNSEKDCSYGRPGSRRQRHHQLLWQRGQQAEKRRNVKTLPEAQRTQGIDSISWINLSARIVQDWFQWHCLNWLQIWSPYGATWISSKFGHQIAPVALVQNLVTRWCHLH